MRFGAHHARLVFGQGRVEEAGEILAVMRQTVANLRDDQHCCPHPLATVEGAIEEVFGNKSRALACFKEAVELAKL